MSETGHLWSMQLGDCVDGMRDLADDSVDVTITDPPYEAEAHTKGKRQGPTSDRKPRVVDAVFDFVAITEELRTAVAEQIARVTTRWAVVFCQVEASQLWAIALDNAGMIYRRTIPWIKPDAMPSLHGRWPGQSFEAIVIANRAGVTAPVGGKARYYECLRERGETRAHPTAKPIELMRQIVDDFTEPGELVLDPFAGSASTGVACAMLGRRFVGFERDPSYYAIACNRLRGDEARPRPEQPSLNFSTTREASDET